MDNTACLVVQFRSSSFSQSILMATKTESDIESDEEFEDLFEGSGQFSWNLLKIFAQLRNQFSKNCLDRVDKITSVVRHLLDQEEDFFPGEVHEWIDVFTTSAFAYMPSEGCSDSLQLIFRHFGDTISELNIKSVVILAIFHQDTGSLQLLHETFGNLFVKKAIEDARKASVFGERVLWASEHMHGDLADFQGFLTPFFEDEASSTDRYDPLLNCTSQRKYIIETIAECGRVDLVEALLVELQSKIQEAETQRMDINATREGSSVCCMPDKQFFVGLQYARCHGYRLETTMPAIHLYNIAE